MIAAMPKLRAAMHLDTVFTFCDRDLVTLYPLLLIKSKRFHCDLMKARPTGIQQQG
jgi:arginine deiminase